VALDHDPAWVCVSDTAGCSGSIRALKPRIIRDSEQLHVRFRSVADVGIVGDMSQLNTRQRT
jgi:hypothetical protein